MKKTIFLTLTLLIIAVCGISFAAGQIKALGNNVTIKETVLAGDKKVAEGITVTTNANYENSPMKWRTAYTVGTEPKLDCEFEYNQDWADDREWPSNSSYVSVYMPLSDTEEWEREYVDEKPDFEEDLATPEFLVQPVIDKTKAGGTYKETVFLQDKLTYYPISFSFGTPWYVYYDDEEADAYFRIPVPKDDRLEIKVQKDTNGNCKQLEIAAEKVAAIEATGIVNEEEKAVYLFLTDMHAYDYNTEKNVRCNLPERICGIHRIPYEEGLNELNRRKLEVDFEKAELVTPMKQGQNVLYPFFSEDKESLMAFSVREDSVNLLVFDADTFTFEQDLCLTDYDKDDEVYWHDQSFIVNDQGDHMLITLEHNKFCLLTKNKEGDWQVEVSDRLLLGDVSCYLAGSDLAFEYSDGTLTLACLSLRDNPVSEWQSAASFQLSVFQDNKRVYDGFYESSLDDDAYTISPDYNDRITLTLPSATSR